MTRQAALITASPCAWLDTEVECPERSLSWNLMVESALQRGTLPPRLAEVIL